MASQCFGRWSLRSESWMRSVQIAIALVFDIFECGEGVLECKKAAFRCFVEV